MARRRRNQKLLDIALEGRWPVAAWLAFGSFVLGFVLLPSMLHTNPITASLSSVAKNILGLVGVLFSGIALVKFLFERSSNTGQLDLVHPHQPAHWPPQVQKSSPSTLDTAWDRTLTNVANRDEPSCLTKPETWSLELLQAIEWKRYEDLSAAFYREKGIRCETTPLGADGGIDIRLFQDENSPQATAVVQCKAWGDRFVGVKPVRELLGVMTHEKIPKAFFMAPGGFTEDAREFALANRITLLDGKLFLAMLNRLPEEARKKLLNFATGGAYTTPTCPSCGIKMLERTGARGTFWGCRNYPRCRQTLNMRKHA